MSLPSTQWSVFEELQRGSDPGAAWGRFQAVYRGPILHWFLGHKVQLADAEDLTQALALKLFEHLGKYDREAGPFRPWLRALLANSLADLHRDRARRPGMIAVGGTAALDQLAAIGAAEPIDDLCGRVDDCRDPRMAAALAVVRAKSKAHTWLAFEALFLQGRPANDVAAELNVSVGAVHQARYRTLAMIAAEYKRLGAPP